MVVCVAWLALLFALNQLFEQKMARMVWFLVIYTGNMYVEINAPFDADAMFDVSHPRYMMADGALEGVYKYMIATWTSILVEHVTGDSSDKDRHVMTAHHMLTLIALIISDVFHHRTIGLYVMMLHDVSDVFIMTLKIIVKSHMFSATTITVTYLVTFTVWLYTRVYLFVGRLVIVDLLINHPKEDLSLGACTAFGCLVLLSFAQMYWTVLIARLAFKNNNQWEREYDNEL